MTTLLLYIFTLQITYIQTKSLSSSCSDSSSLGLCIRPLLQKWENIRVEEVQSINFTFPVVFYSIDSITSLCESFQEVRHDCIKKDEDSKSCHPIWSFIDSHLAFTCDHLSPDNLDEFSCLVESLQNSTECHSNIKGTPNPLNHKERCIGMTQFWQCSKRFLYNNCGSSIVKLLHSIISSFGCTVTDENESVEMRVAASLNVEDDTKDNANNTFEVEKIKEKMNEIKKGKSSNNTDVYARFVVTEAIFQPIEENSNNRSIETNVKEIFRRIETNDLTDKETKRTMANTRISEEKPILQNIPIEESELNSISESKKRTVAVSKINLTDLTTKISTTTRTTTTTTSTTTKIDLSSNTPDNKETQFIEDDQNQVFEFPLSDECDKETRNKARVCVSPLMRTLIEIRDVRPEIVMVSFPLYKYTRFELLELCDGYANTFHCAGLDNMTKCMNDELVRFARDHLGYICSPDNIQRFMKHYDCIMEQEALAKDSCRRHIYGTAVPGKDQHKCNGVSSYHSCLLPLISSNCQHGAVREFEESIRQYGCHIH